MEDLESYAYRLRDALELGDAPIDVAAILDLAAEAAHTVMRPAAPLTTWVAGYATALAVARGAEPEEAAAAVTAQLQRVLEPPTA